MLHVFGVDIGHDGDGRGQAVEAAIGFVGLDHHPLTGTGAGVGSVSVDHAAIDDGWVEIARIQQRRHHGRGGGFAVGARDGHVGFQAHQLGQHLGAAHDRKALAAGLLQFGIALLDRGRDHHDARLADILGPLAFENARAQAFQPVGDLGFLRVGPLHVIAERHQHLGDARHADAADADEMDGAQFAGKFGGCVHGASSVTRS